MPRLALGLFTLVLAGPALAQPVPGRDLLNHPLGLAAEAAALGTGPASGLWNPATGVLEPGDRGRLAMAALNAPIDLGLSAQVVHGAVRLDRIGTIEASVAHAGISDLARTETDPQSVGSDIVYSTLVTSVGVARRVASRVAVGAALRWHWGRIDRHRRSAIGGDAGILVDGIGRADLRAGASTFLWSGGGSTPVAALAVDARAFRLDSLRSVRVGVARTVTRRTSTETYTFAEARYAALRVRGGPVHTDAYGSVTWHPRFGLAVEHDGYTVALAREDNTGGLDPTYQLTVAKVWR